MEVEYVDHMGNDLTVANAARVSFSKRKKVFDEADKKLLKYLAKNNHWTPFSHPQITLRVKAPVFLRAQLFKHKVGMTENEVSRRYVDDEPEIYTPSVWRCSPTDGAKQGSSGEHPLSDHMSEMADEVNYLALRTYDRMIKYGVAPEQARMVLPQSMYTEWVWTGSLAAYARICKLRLDEHAQRETAEVASMISDIIQPLFPHSWEALSE